MAFLAILDHMSRDSKVLGGSWYLSTNQNCTFHCTVYHFRALKGLMSGLSVQLSLVNQYHEPPSTECKVARDLSVSGRRHLPLCHILSSHAEAEFGNKHKPPQASQSTSSRLGTSYLLKNPKRIYDKYSLHYPFKGGMFFYPKPETLNPIP